MASNRGTLQHGSRANRLVILALQSAALAAAWAVWNPLEVGLLGLALACVLATWIVAGGITLWIYLAFSLAPFSDLLAASLQASAMAMWLVPGTLLLASRSPPAVVVGLAVVINSARLLASSRAPQGEMIKVRRRAGRSGPLLFRGQPERPALSRETVPPMLGALALQTGIYAIAGGYPLLAAVSFATVTAIWVALAVARGAMEARTEARVPYSSLLILLTLLLTVELTAALVRKEIVRQGPAETLATTKRLLQRLAHSPPEPPPPSKVDAAAPRTVMTRVVGPNDVPGVVLRPQPMRSRRPPLVVRGSRFQLSPTQPLGIPFTGEYHLFPASSGSLPRGAGIEIGTPLEMRFGTTSGEPMETLAVQTFDPPIDLTHCGKVLVVLTSAKVELLLVSMQLVAKRSVEDGGFQLMYTKGAPGHTLEFQVPATVKPLLVYAIRILFQRLADRDENPRVAVAGFTLVPRGF